jgi:MFS family permease
MSSKKSFFILIILSVIPVLQGYDSHVRIEYGILLMKYNLSNFHIDFFKSTFPLGTMIGALIGGFLVDKKDLRTLISSILITASVLSLVIQFVDFFALLTLHRFVLGFMIGFLVICSKVYITDIADSKNRGRFLYYFLSASIIGSVSYLIFRYFVLVKSNNFSLTYSYYQIPYIILPLLVLFVVRFLPNNRDEESNVIYNLKYFFRPKQRILIYSMIILAILTSFANANLFVYVSSQITFKQEADFFHMIPTGLGILAAISGIITIDILGRKGLLMLGLFILIVSAISNIVVSVITDNPVIILAFLHLYYFSFLFTIITTSTIVILEYLPTQIRGRGIIIFAIICWVPNGIVNVLNKSVIFDSKNNIIISSIIVLTTLVAMIFLVRKFLIETKGLLLDEIKSELNIE